MKILKFHEFIRESELIDGGLSSGMSLKDIAAKHKVEIKTIESQLKIGISVEKEHTKNEKLAKEIAMDHLVEDPNYYTKLSKIETDSVNEATIYNLPPPKVETLLKGIEAWLKQIKAEIELGFTGTSAWKVTPYTITFMHKKDSVLLKQPNRLQGNVILDSIWNSGLTDCMEKFGARNITPNYENASVSFNIDF